MEFDFIDNAPVEVTERSKVIRKFINYINEILEKVPEKCDKNDSFSTNTKSLKIKKDDTQVEIYKQIFKGKQSVGNEKPLEYICYEINLERSNFSDQGGAFFRSERYKYIDSDSPLEFVERMTGCMTMDVNMKETNSNHTTNKYEVSDTELVKMMQCVSKILAEGK